MNGLKLVMAIVETLFAIPVLGMMIIVGMIWIPLGLALVGHIVCLVFSVKNSTKKRAPIMGIIAATVGLIPFVGWVLHILTAIFYYMEAFNE